MIKKNIRHIVCKEFRQTDFHAWHSLPREWRNYGRPKQRHKCDDVENKNNNNNKGSRGTGEVAPLYGVDPAQVLTNPGVQ